MICAASGPGESIPWGRIAEALTDLGWRQDGLQPITSGAARRSAAVTLSLLENLTVGPRPRSWPAHLSPDAVELARDALAGPSHAR